MTGPALIAVEPNLRGFVEGVRAAAADGERRFAVLPEDNLAAEIRTRVPELAQVPPERAEVLCITHVERDALERALLGELDRRAGSIIIPRLPGHGLDRWLFLISIPKAGTHLLYRLAERLGFKPGVVCPENPKPGHWYCIEYSNSHTTPRDFFVDSVRRAPFGNRAHPFVSSPALLIVRHPWDILVSEANYYSRPGNAAFSAFYQGLDFEAGVHRLLNDDRLLGRFRDRLLAYEPWLGFENVIPLAFEDLVGELGGGEADRQERLIWSLQLKLAIPGAAREIAADLFDTASPTFREGQVGAHLAALSPELKAHLDAADVDVLGAFGYAPGTVPYTARAEDWYRRPLRCPPTSFDDTPILEEMNFLDHNLVRFRRRFYAIPIETGSLDLSLAEALDGFAQAETLTALRSELQARYVLEKIANNSSPQVVQHEPNDVDLQKRIAGLEAALAERTARLSALEETIEERTARLQDVERALAEKQNRILSLEATLTERDARLKAIEQNPAPERVVDIVTRLSALEATMQERSTRLLSVESALEERQQRIVSLETTLTERDQRLKFLEAKQRGGALDRLRALLSRL
jgi:predicted  nucleic acid-binding Zn-ribbon protein